MDSGALIKAARAAAGLSLRELARRARTSHSTLVAYEQGRKDPTVGTLVRILRAADVEPDVSLARRRRHDDRFGDKGDELLEALELAAMFPARHARSIEFPPFPAGRDRVAS
ncbi:MAG: helix-turn-helix transcriptional regulator [Actinomycetota bacterium]